MRSDLFGFIAVLGVVAFTGWPQPAPAQAPTPTLPGPAANAPRCNALRDVTEPLPLPAAPAHLTLRRIDAGLLTSGMPCEDNVTDRGPDDRTTPIENRQRGFDFYSWLSFIALSAPADPRKDIAHSEPDSPTVWEDPNNFKPLLEVMLPGENIPEWTRREIPQACLALHTLHPQRMVVKMIEESFNEPFKTGALIDQRNNYAIFDILMNKVMFDYIVAHKLHSKAGQMSADNAGLRIDFPSADNSKNEIGAVMLKVSWRILTPEDDKGKFHRVEALVAMPNTPDEQRDPPCLERTLGLVGIHIVHKTKARPQWIWTSFEHVDNVPEQQEVDAHAKDPANNKLKTSYNFYDPSCSVQNCPVNETPPRPWDPEPANQLQFERGADGRVRFNSQITRVTALTPANKLMNTQFQAILAGTVWKNYMLIGTQWPSGFPCAGDHADKNSGLPDPRTDFEKQPDMNCAPAPTFMANSTLETFSQGEVPQASSSCMACHGNATSYIRPKRPNDIYFNQSDFTFMLEKAR
jgi:hypothetical protein